MRLLIGATLTLFVAVFTPFIMADIVYVTEMEVLTLIVCLSPPCPIELESCSR